MTNTFQYIVFTLNFLDSTNEVLIIISAKSQSLVLLPMNHLRLKIHPFMEANTETEDVCRWQKIVGRRTVRLASDVFDCKIPSSNRNGWLARFGGCLGPGWKRWEARGEPKEFLVQHRQQESTTRENSPLYPVHVRNGSIDR